MDLIIWVFSKQLMQHLMKLFYLLLLGLFFLFRENDSFESHPSYSLTLDSSMSHQMLVIHLQTSKLFSLIYFFLLNIRLLIRIAGALTLFTWTSFLPFSLTCCLKVNLAIQLKAGFLQRLLLLVEEIKLKTIGNMAFILTFLQSVPELLFLFELNIQVIQFLH